MITPQQLAQDAVNKLGDNSFALIVKITPQGEIFSFSRKNFSVADSISFLEQVKFRMLLGISKQQKFYEEQSG